MALFEKPASPPPISFALSLRRLVVFQIKLAIDALRDFALSPISILAFIVDALRRPAMEDSLYLRVMRLGRRSDRVINLFDEYSDGEHYTVDETLSEVEQTLQRGVRKEQIRRQERGERELP